MDTNMTRVLLVDPEGYFEDTCNNLLVSDERHTFLLDCEQDFSTAKDTLFPYIYDVLLLTASNINTAETYCKWLKQNTPSLPVILIHPTTTPEIAQLVEANICDALHAENVSDELLRRAILLAKVRHSRPPLLEDLLRKTFYSLSDEITIVDKSYRVVMSNQEALKTQNESMCFPVCFNEISGDVPCSWCGVDEVFSTGQQVIKRIRNAYKGASWELSFSPLFNTHGNVMLVVEHKRDISHEVAAEDVIRQREEQYRVLADNIPNGLVIMFDPALNVMVATGGMLSTLGISPGMLEGKRIRYALSPDIAKVLDSHFRQAINGQSGWLVLTFNNRCFEIHVLPIHNNEGNIDSGMAVAWDITNQREASMELEASERRFKAIFNNSLDGISVYERFKGSTERRLLDCNQAYASLSGRKRRELLSCDDIGIYQRIDPMKLAAMQRKILREEPCSGMFEWVRPDGKVNHMEFHATPVRNGNRVLVYEIVRDMTHRIIAEEKLVAHSETLEKAVASHTEKLRDTLLLAEEARERLDVILKSVADGLIVSDTQGRVIMTNTSAEHLLQQQPINLLGTNFTELVQDDTWNKEFEDIISSNQETSHPFTVVLPHGTNGKRFVRTRFSAVRDRRQNLVGIVASLDDVTREHEVDKMKDEFISTAAHELRIPLTSILGFSELIMTRKELSQDETVHYSKLINQSAATLSSIVSDLLDISLIESGKGFSLKVTKTDIVGLVQEMLESYKEKHSSHSFTFKPSSPVLPIQIDSDKISQVLENLLSNAVKYSPDKSSITIRIHNSPRWCTISIHDEGVGMNAEQVRRVFEKFYRGHADNGCIQGTGLGMSIVRHIVTRHGGNVWVDSKPDEGTIVYFTLPLFSSAISE